MTIINLNAQQTEILVIKEIIFKLKEISQSDFAKYRIE
jgi:hypothetical protein